MRSNTARATADAGRSAFDAPDPIDAYLDALRHSLRNQSDADELVDEAEDHLREAVSRQVLAGADPLLAHEAVLTEFGDAGLVAKALVRARLHTVPEASRATRAAGVLGGWAGLAWLVTLLVKLYQAMADPWRVEQYVWFQLAFGVATLLTVVLIVGLFARAGALRSVWTPVAVLLTMIALLGNTVFSWMWPVTNPMLGLALWIALLECRRAGLGLGSGPIQLAALIWPLATVAAVVGRTLAIGPVDDWGEYSLVYEWAFPCAAALFALACWLIGSTMARETLPEGAPAAARLVAAVPISGSFAPATAESTPEAGSTPSRSRQSDDHHRLDTLASSGLDDPWAPPSRIG